MDIQTTSKKITNLVQLVAELPSDVPADQFYEQIKQMNQKLLELKSAKENLAHQSHELMKFAIDEKALKAKIKRTIENLDQVTGEKQRPIFGNLIKFIEIHPTKLKMGIYAPTGTDGEVLNLTEEKEGKLLSLSPNQRMGSSTVGNGAGCHKLQEPGRLVVSQTYCTSWDRIYLNLTEVARLRWVERWSLSAIALHFATTPTAIKERLRAAKLNPSRIDWTVIDPKHVISRRTKKRSVA